MMLPDRRLSRPALAAERLGDFAPDRHRFSNKRVLLTGEPAILQTANGQSCFVDSLRLLVRICKDVSITMPSTTAHLLAACEAILAEPFVGRSARILDPSSGFAGFDAILSVGTTARPELPWTVINSNGWTARVSSGSCHLSTDCQANNPIGSLAAASLGVTDVFKRLIGLKQQRGRLFDGVVFNLHTYSCNEDSGPAITALPNCDLLLVGVGAIGNGIVHLLRQLPLCGRVLVVDRQKYGDENFGTCILVGSSDVGRPKAELAASILGTQFQVQPFEEGLEEFKSRLGILVPYPRVVLTGLDNIDARHEAQTLWPDLILDGAVGDFACQVSQHKWGHSEACLMCQFRHPSGPDALAIASRVTGLGRSRVSVPDGLVTREDISIAPDERRQWLELRLGKPICSVIQEGVASQISKDRLQAGFAPTVPFVACMSACMVVGELAKHLIGEASTLQGRYQFDVLKGPLGGMMIPQMQRPDCDCVVRAHNIETWRRRIN